MPWASLVEVIVMDQLLFGDISLLSHKALSSYINSIEDEELKSPSNILTIIDNFKKDTRKNVYNLGLKLENRLIRYSEEVTRIKALYNFDKGFGDFVHIAGVDEVGRGPLAGPIVAAAVVLKNELPLDNNIILGLNDSKKVPLEKREELYDIITKEALFYKIALIDNEEIDSKGIGYCNNMVFIKACEGLGIKPEIILSDGYPIRNYNVNNRAVIKGDTKSAAIAAASIIAKVYRDRIMKEYSFVYPQYGFEKHVGYGTKEHIEAITKYGITPIHRKSFLKSII